ncbi:MAG: TonB-dependent receptor [Sphingomonadales bacterium]|nr:TonB-dependent receptor [Sphingomonadales bacterium]MDE2171497.1 TonB-dependent receptor [Sphingomonadales bacterium]
MTTYSKVHFARSTAVTAVAIALLVPMNAAAQDAAATAQGTPPAATQDTVAAPSEPPSAPTSAPAPSDEGIVVTGSRVASGFKTPTPVAISTAEQLRAQAPTNLADGLNQLPVFNGSTKTSSPSTTNSRGGNSGQNLLNLRGLGAQRTLVLLDGRRMPATNSGGSVDINILPQSLISRVDVVTGGASAAYGSDAVAGVVNFVLDTKFKGFKAEALGGISTHGDLPSAGGSLAYGTSRLDDRLHIVVGGDYFYQRGLRADEKTGRAWFDDNAGLIANPATGSLPRSIIIPSIRSSAGTYGGLITSGPLKGTQFLPGGVSAPFNYGTNTGTAFQSGGDGARANIGLMPTQERYNAFARAEYDLSDQTSVFVEGLYANSHTVQGAFVSQNTGSSAAYTIFRDNAYLPPDILARMVAANVQSFQLGRFEGELPLAQNESKIKVYHGSVGVRGALGGAWKYDASYTFGQTNQELRSNNLTIARNLYAAADAVRDPATGNIVCRSTLAGLDPGCTPRNLFGPQQPNQAITDYVTGDNVLNLRLRQQVVSANIRGDLGEHIQLAGPIAVAAGFEYRKESANQTTDALSPTKIDFTGIRGGPASLNGRQGPYRFFNPLPFSGAYDIREGYLEVAVPVLKDVRFARSLDLNGAVRYADYSTSGGVTTWKVGASWQIDQALRLRGTVSRDIRAPNLLELYNPATQLNGNVVYKGVQTAEVNFATGNPNLKPERALTTTFGGVFQPDFLPGFSASIDYYRIKLSDAITTLTEQRVVDECAEGNQVQCANITVLPSGSLSILRPNLNLASQTVAGIDFELGYKTSLAGGKLALRVVGNHATENNSQSPGSPVLQALGETTTPRWSGIAQATWTKDDFSLFVQERYIGPALLNAAWVEGVDVNINHTPAVFYTNLTGTYNLHLGGGKQQVYLSVANLFDRDPPLSPPPVTTFTTAASSAYDPIGRYITMGVRVSF